MHAHTCSIYAMEEHTNLLGLISNDAFDTDVAMTITIRFYIKCKEKSLNRLHWRIRQSATELLLVTFKFPPFHWKGHKTKPTGLSEL